jgi:hypothetical protein
VGGRVAIADVVKTDSHSYMGSVVEVAGGGANSPRSWGPVIAPATVVVCSMAATAQALLVVVAVAATTSALLLSVQRLAPTRRC